MSLGRILSILLFVGILVGCAQRDTLRIGGKDFGESQILSEMMAALAEAEGIPVTRRIGLGPTRMNLEALKRGDIDLYAEYNGTGLVMVGQPALTDGDAAQERVEALYKPLGLVWGPRFGFGNTYGLLMRADTAAALGVTRVSDLVERAGDLSIGIESDFQSRPLDGFGPLTSRYGMSFGLIRAVELEQRAQLYDLLLDGSLDVIEGFTTDGQIADYGLVLLEDDLGFFRAYEAAPFARADALERFPALSGVFASLAGRIDDALMQELNRRVDIDGYPPRAVARAALVEMGLLADAGTVDANEPLVLAASDIAAGGRDVNAALRAVRAAFPGRPIQLVETASPLGLIAEGRARLALAGAEEFFALDASGAPVPSGVFEAVGVVGDAVLHILALDPGVTDIRQADMVATAAEGSGSAAAADTLMRGFGLEAPVAHLGAETPEDLAAAILASGADAAVLMAPLGNPVVERLVAEGDARLLPLHGWEDGPNLVRYPYLRQMRIAARTYEGQAQPVETLASQLVLAGTGPVERDAIGDQGPGTVTLAHSLPLAADTVQAINAALPNRIDVDPSLPQAPVLAPQMPDAPAPMNPAPGVSLLSVLLLLMLLWMLWLYGRPERR